MNYIDMQVHEKDMMSQWEEIQEKWTVISGGKIGNIVLGLQHLLRSLFTVLTRTTVTHTETRLWI